jgi:hypothetical protein
MKHIDHEDCLCERCAKKLVRRADKHIRDWIREARANITLGGEEK